MMAWDRLKLMAALVVFAFLALVFLANRLDPNRAPSDRRWARWRWSGSKKKTALVLGAFVGVGLVVLVNRLDGSDTPQRRVTIERVISNCTDEQGRAVNPPWEGREGIAYLRGDGERVFYRDDKGNEISCSGLLGVHRPAG
ncbi:MAG: hypothetical protein AB1679_31415 [Actinomycetota bacterium]|jgi:hypothetical protein